MELEDLDSLLAYTVGHISKIYSQDLKDNESVDIKISKIKE